MICNSKKQVKTYRCKSFLRHVQTQPHQALKNISASRVSWCSCRSFPLFMSRPWLNSCELANVRCHAALSDGKHMSTEVGRKTQPQSSLDSVTIQWRGKKGLQTRLSPSLCLSQLLPTMSRLFLLFPRNSISHPTRSAKKKKKAAFHFRVHLVPKICKVLNREVVLSQLHTEPFIPILGENNCRKISQPAQLIRHRALEYMFIQLHFPSLTVSSLKTASRYPKACQMGLQFSRCPKPV